MKRRQLTSRQILERAMSEDELLTAVTEALTARGYRWIHERRSDLAQQIGFPGWPDIFAVGHGRILSLELKTETGRVDPEQSAWLVSLQAVGVDTRILRPRDLNDFLRELKR